MTLQRSLIWLALFIIFLAFAAFVPLVLWGAGDTPLEPAQQIEFLVLVIGFGASLFVMVSHMRRALKQYVEDLHDLSADDAENLVSRLLFGPSRTMSPGSMLRVESGQVDLEGPPVVHKVGGPAMLNVDHNSVVVTSRLGILSRVLGPGIHTLRPFERVWDIVDMRPQRRTVTVEFITRDGIPASCQASIVCRIASSDGEHPTESVPRFGYSEKAVLQVTTSKSVRKQDGSDRISDWVTGIANGVMVGTVREVLEQYCLDELLNPQYWLEDEDGPARSAAAPQLLPELEATVQEEVHDAGESRGIVVERIELGMVRPAEVAISRQWLEFWQAKLQKNVDRYTMEATTTHERLAENARAEAQAAFVNRMLEEVQQLRSNGVTMPPELVIMSFLEVLYAMSDQAPRMQRLLFQQAESLIHVVNAIRREDSPFTSTSLDRRSR